MDEREAKAGRHDGSPVDRASLFLPIKNPARGMSLTEEPRGQPHLSKSLSTPAEYKTHPPRNFFLSDVGTSSTSSRAAPHRQLSRAQSIRDSITTGTARFFGVPAPVERQSSSLNSVDQKWNSRRMRYMKKRYGECNRGLFTGGIDLVDLTSPRVPPSPIASAPIPTMSADTTFVTPPTEVNHATVSRSTSIESRASRVKLERRDSVAKMAWDEISSLVQRGTLRNIGKRACAAPVGSSRGRSASSSFSPWALSFPTAVATRAVPPRTLDISSSVAETAVPQGEEYYTSSRPRMGAGEFQYCEYGPSSADSRKSGRAAFGSGMGMATVVEVPDEGNLPASGKTEGEVGRPSGESGPSTPGTFGSVFSDEETGPADVVEVAELPPGALPSRSMKKFLSDLPEERESFESENEGGERLSTKGGFDWAVAGEYPSGYKASHLRSGMSVEAIEDEKFFDLEPVVLSSSVSSFSIPSHARVTVSSGGPSSAAFTEPTKFLPAASAARLYAGQRRRVPRAPRSASSSSRILEYPPVQRTPEEERVPLIPEPPEAPTLSIERLREADGERYADPSKYERRNVPAVPVVDVSSLRVGPSVAPHTACMRSILGRQPFPSRAPVSSDPDRPPVPVTAPKEEMVTRGRGLGLDYITSLTGSSRIRDVTGFETSKFLRGSSKLERIHQIFVSRQKPETAMRRRYGFGFGIWRKLFRRDLTRGLDGAIERHLDSFDDYRPFFTYWVTTVQIVVTLVSLMTYGFGPFGFGRRERTADVLHSSVTLKHVSIYEQENFWIGPKFADLVHLGATFTPCMRHDPRIYTQIEADRALERETGCCVYNDGTGCFQSGQDTCPRLIASLVKWGPTSPGPSGRRSGAVCGQDPKYCSDPASVSPFDWPDDITQWPICRRQALMVLENERHLTCEITGRPCCIQLHGQCRIATRDYCDFVHGYFHENATLCSQVSCLGEVCGMLPFMTKDQPDQIYRLFIPIFLHAGLLHCAVTIAIQWYYMRDLEKLIGWARMAILYLGAGIGGNLASAIFVPYKPEVGPSGSHIGIFAAMYADLIYNWSSIDEPVKAMKELSVFMLILFAIGLLPWIDNWAHMFGFVFGLLISLGTFPYIQWGENDRTKRLVIVITSLSSASGLFTVLLLLFYSGSAFECPLCEYFNCIPFTDHLCENQGLRLQSWLPI